MLILHYFAIIFCLNTELANLVQIAILNETVSELYSTASDCKLKFFVKFSILMDPLFSDCGKTKLSLWFWARVQIEKNVPNYF